MGKQQSAFEVKRYTGLDFRTVGPEALSAAGIFPIVKVNQPFNERLFKITMSWDTSTGYAVRNFTATAKPLAEAINEAKFQLTDTASRRVINLRSLATSFGPGILRAADGIDDSIRPARFDKWIDRISSVVSTLDTQLVSIDNASTVDQLNDIVSPAHGTIVLGVDESNPLNFLASDFKLFYSKNYTKSDMELYFPGTNTTVAYSSGFAATASAVTDEDKTVQLRVASTGIIVDEFFLRERSSTDSGIPQNFGYRSHADSRFDPDEEDAVNYEYLDLDPVVYTVTVSGGKFYIDGVETPSLSGLEGEVYKFDQSDASNASHPLRIYSDADKTTEVVARVVAVGTPGTAGAYTEYIPGVAGEFSYQCQSHAGMGGEIVVMSAEYVPGSSANRLVSSGY